MNRMALDARCTLAMARVVAPFDPAASEHLEQRAVELASSAAWYHESGSLPPRFFDDEPALLTAFTVEQERVDAFAAYMEAHPAAIWSGGWTPSLDGCWETCACVARTREGYLPGLFVSHMGGDCCPRYGAAVASQAQAIVIARAHECAWHREDGTSDEELDGG